MKVTICRTINRHEHSFMAQFLVTERDGCPGDTNVFVVQDTAPTDGPIPQLSEESSLFISLMSSGEPVPSGEPVSSDSMVSSDMGPMASSDVFSMASETMSSLVSAIKYVLCISDSSGISTNPSSEPEVSSADPSTTPSTTPSTDSSEDQHCAEAIPIRVLISIASLADMFYIPVAPVDAGELYRTSSITLTFKSRIQMESVIRLIRDDIKINNQLQKLNIPAFEEVELSDSVGGETSSSEQNYLFP